MILLTLNTSSIDAAIWHKGLALKQIDLPLNKIAGIGDGELDIPFLKSDLFAIGCPSNSRKKVISYMKENNGFIAKQPILEGFFEFVEHIKQKAGTEFNKIHLLTDKDGVIYKNPDLSHGAQFAKFIKQSGYTQPITKILTGSALYQCKDAGFIEAYGLTKENLQDNEFIQKDPYILLCESGAVQLNVLDHTDIKYLIDEKSTPLLKVLLGEFKKTVLQRTEKELFAKFNLNWEQDYTKQHINRRGVHAVNRRTAVTINVPYDIRETDQGEIFRNTVFKIMKEETIRYDIPLTEI
jgi:hypothetical protein